MGLTVYAHIHQSENVAFDDIAALNKELEEDTSIGELTEEAVGQPGYNGFFRLDDPNDLKLAQLTDKEFSSYEKGYCMVYGCLEDDEAEVVAKHLTAGKIVIHKEIEGNPAEFLIITPGKVQTKSIEDVKF